ncbi:LCP family protein [Actinomycetospora endophytica]|uniref:LCP family protein n=1 Tax=Actinomycetospora endophytica TaxID=2291215 RepID=A0ABS8P3N7_9PSEU|nr:LCP family protein [Actinomycetospora endophytica]MCD2192867.1 LCP family protein [Actinomycetospora endophytica]
MNDDRERGARSGAPRARSTTPRPETPGPPSVPTRIGAGTPSDPVRRGAVPPSMVPLARKRAVRRGLRPGGAAATTEPLRDVVETASRADVAPPAEPEPPSPPRGPARSALVPPQQPARPLSGARPPWPPRDPEGREPTERMLPASRAPADREPTERMLPRPAPSAPTPAVAPTLAPAVTPTTASGPVGPTPVRGAAPLERPATRSVASGKDDAEWAATSAVASGVGRRLSRLRRRWTWGHTRRLLATATSVVVVLVCGLAWGATSWFETAVRQIAALDPTSSAILDPAAQAGDQNFLVVGSDTRVGAVPSEDVGDASDVAGARSDTVMIVHVPADRSRVTVVSFPRDLEIDRPACEHWDSVSGNYTPQTMVETPQVKLNSAYQVGGPRCTTKVVQQLSGLAINHFLAVDFSGFKDMVDAVDGVPICVDKPMRDTILGTVIPRAGTSVLTGDQALNFVRARHVVGDPTSDYGRIHRQQLFLSALLRQSLSAGTLLDLGKLQNLVGAVSRSTYGENIEADQLLSLGQSLSGLSAGDVTFTTVPTTGVANSRGNEVLRGADDRALFDAVIDDRPLPGQPGAAPPAAPAPTVPADRVALTLVDDRSGSSGSGDTTNAASSTTRSSVDGTDGSDGSGGSGGDSTSSASGFRNDRSTQGPSRTSVAGALRGYGFTVTSGGAPTSSASSASRTAIRFTPDQAGAAATLQRAVPGAVLTPQQGGSGGLVLALGDDFDGRVLDPAAPPPAAPAPALVNAADSVCS